MTADDERPADWTEAAKDRLIAAIKAMPASKDQAGSNPSKEEPRG